MDKAGQCSEEVLQLTMVNTMDQCVEESTKYRGTFLKVRLTDLPIRHSYLAYHPPGQICCHTKFATSPPGGSVNRRFTSRLHATSTMPRKATSNPRPKKHNFLPFKDKLELIRKCDAGIAHSVVTVQMGLPRSTVSTIWKNRDKYCETAASTTFLQNSEEVECIE
ncbi:hypothetical protein E2C01_055789 [Portunus trituberculatus]|uniref:HTH psq-type domain-containing protein n=1 Tax=Portunus trituberculatus TaxID=210409 RepID=A0A5B7GYM5_PORTR|nr:hypothetical protein [Portunus trituberculatus]